MTSETRLPGVDVANDVERALREDVGAGDLTARLVPAGQRASARVICRESALLCGQPWFAEVFRQLDPAIDIAWAVGEGARVGAEELICEVRGPARPILTGERTALNLLQTLSATATMARRYVDAITGTRARILDTRKTIPGLRLAQKYAVRTGGADNHRIGLFDGVLIKENHILAGGGITAAVAAMRAGNGGVLVEIEVETLDQVREAFAAGAGRLLLDNFGLDRILAAVKLRDQIAPTITLEASGGITLANARAVAETGVDFISVGDLTKNIRAVDLSMRFKYG